VKESVKECDVKKEVSSSARRKDIDANAKSVV
jgi:hypothetical protein